MAILLLEVLEMNGYHGTRTMKVNRLGIFCPFAVTAAFKHLDRGSMRSMQTTMTSSNEKWCIKLTHWLGNDVITLAPSTFGTNAQKQSRR